jgi:hypothetical protein
MTKVSDKKHPAAFFVFQDQTTMVKKAGLTIDLANAIPNIASLLGDSDEKIEYRYRGDVSQNAVNAYFRSVSARIKGVEFNGFAELSIVDWNFVFWLAFRLGDSQFYETYGPNFPPMMDVADKILHMPEPARLFYLGTYLGECFAFDCNCDRHRIKLLRKEAQRWMASLDSVERTRYENTPISGAYRNYKRQLVHTYDQDEKFKDDWLATNLVEIEAERIYNWYELDMEIKVHLVHIGAKLPPCACKRSFDEMWTAFCSMIPPIADFLWTNMKRDELMKYAVTSDDKKDGVARRKKTIEDLRAYVDFTRDRK